jgi:hypothetical protein
MLRQVLHISRGDVLQRFEDDRRCIDITLQLLALSFGSICEEIDGNTLMIFDSRVYTRYHANCVTIGLKTLRIRAS